MGRPRRPVEPILDLLVQGKLPKQIGRELGIGNAAVDYHLRRYMAQNGLRNIVQVALEYDRKKRF